MLFRIEASVSFILRKCAGRIIHLRVYTNKSFSASLIVGCV